MKALAARPPTAAEGIRQVFTQLMRARPRRPQTIGATCSLWKWLLSTEVLGWVIRFNQRRLRGPIGISQPAETEQIFYAQRDVPTAPGMPQVK